MPSIIDRGQPEPRSPEQMRLLSLPGGPLGPYNNQEIDTLRRDRNAGDVLGDVLKGLLMGGIPGAIGEGIFGPQKRETDVTKELRRKGDAYLADEPFREARGNELKRIWEEEDRPADQARQRVSDFRSMMGLQNDLADQAMQTQRFTWDQEDRNAQSAEARAKVDAAKALRSQHDAANMAQVNAYAQAIQKVGKPYSPDTLSAATAMAKVLEPREFQIWAKDLFETEAGGGDATDLKAKALKGFADFTKAQRDAEIVELNLELERANLELKDAGEKNTGSEFDKAKLRSAAQIRQHLEDKKMLAILKKSAAWNPDLGSRSMTQYNQMFAGEDVSAWIETKYDAIAERDFMLRYKRPPQTPEENAMVSELARQLAAEGGWEP